MKKEQTSSTESGKGILLINIKEENKSNQFLIVVMIEGYYSLVNTMLKRKYYKVKLQKGNSIIKEALFSRVLEFPTTCSPRGDLPCRA